MTIDHDYHTLDVVEVIDETADTRSFVLAIQDELRGLVADIPEARRLLFRIGIHLGDVIEKADGTVYGDGVNIAARLQAIAEPGGIVISDSVRIAVKGKVDAIFLDQSRKPGVDAAGVANIELKQASVELLSESSKLRANGPGLVRAG